MSLLQRPAPPRGHLLRRGRFALAALGVAALVGSGLPLAASAATATGTVAASLPGAVSAIPGPTVRASSAESGTSATDLASAPVSSQDAATEEAAAQAEERARVLREAEDVERSAGAAVTSARTAAAAAATAHRNAQSTATRAVERSRAAAARAARLSKRGGAVARRARVAARAAAATSRRASAAATAARVRLDRANLGLVEAERTLRRAQAAVATAREAAVVVPRADGWRKVTWRSIAQVRGARLDLAWPAATSLSRLRVAGSGASDAFRSGVLSFSDGSSLQVTAGPAGDLDISFPRRQVASAALTVELGQPGATTVSLSALRLDDGGTWRTTAATTTPSATAGTAAAALDGDLAAGRLGEAWSAGQVASADLGLRFSTARVLASVQVIGLQQNVIDPAASSADPVRGEVVFSDGSRVPLPGISGGASEPTVVAFTPRVVTGATVRLTRLAPGASVGAREVAFYDVGSTPARAEATGTGYVAEAPTTESCDPATRATVASRLLLCPVTGSSVTGPTTIAVRSEPGSTVTARAHVPGRGVVTVATTRTTDAGIASLGIDASQLARGPLNVGLVKGESAATRPFVYAQLFNRGGIVAPTIAAGRQGMTLQWSDDFERALSVSSWGEGATYAAVKPEYWGEGHFGSAMFMKPESGAKTLVTDSGNLRIRVKDAGTVQDPSNWGRKHLGGIMSSMRVGGSGFSAQHGYFEARMLGAPGKGTWPAFWMMDTTGATQKGTGAAETDAVELYGHSTLGSCHTIHTWVATPTGSGACPDPNGYGDWALGWHTYGVQIVPNGADFYIDGKLVTSRRGQEFTDRPMFFMLNLALGGGWPVDLAGTDSTADLWVDWVRVYT